MHDPMGVAWEIPSPIPHRVKWREGRNDRRWGFYRARLTNPENLGQPIYPWWRPRGWHLRIGGREYGLGRLATIWHVEPGGRDSGAVCKHRLDGKVSHRWKWHIHHWHIQVHFAGRLRRFLFERCISCGYRFPWGYAPISHQWDGPKSRWFRISRDSYHHACSSVVSYKRTSAQRDDLIRELFAALRVTLDTDEAVLLDRLTRHDAPLEFNHRRTLISILGYEWDDSLNLVHVICEACGDPITPVRTAYHRHRADGSECFYHRDHLPVVVS
jgi:hypothetical protein